MFLIRPFIVTGLALFLVSWLVPVIQFANLWTLLGAAIVLTLLQLVVEPALNILLLPINIITLGLFSCVINAFILWLAAVMVPGFVIVPLILFGIQLGWFMTLIICSFFIGLAQSLVRTFIP
jgi:putative membrane protein